MRYIRRIAYIGVQRSACESVYIYEGVREGRCSGGEWELCAEMRRAGLRYFRVILGVVSGLFKCYVSTSFWGLSQSFSAVNVPRGCAWMQVE